MSAALLAHAGGWDEILMVAGPLLVIGFALFVADRRARTRHRDEDTDVTSS